ncbi:MAG: hypothetical protein HOP29_07530 [Phycisphaerales bacterium]|nr:hypothetical protein [Phycisphaerales bacterium]
MRFRWAPNTSRIARIIGCPMCPPGSPTFIGALARWQLLNGLPVTGVIAPADLSRMQDALKPASPSTPPSAAADASSGAPGGTSAAPDGATTPFPSQPAADDAVPPDFDGDDDGSGQAEPDAGDGFGDGDPDAAQDPANEWAAGY